MRRVMLLRRKSRVPSRRFGRSGSGRRHGGGRRRLRAASLLEAIVAAVLFLIVFASAMELIPRLTVRGDEALLTAEAEYRVARAFDKYASGLWPAGEYAERYDWGEVTVRISPYRAVREAQQLTVTATIDGSRKRIVHRQVVEWYE